MSQQRMNIKFVSSTKVKRSLLSCNDCRRRKKRCDELKPKCSSCAKRAVDCIYTQKLGSNGVKKPTTKKQKSISHVSPSIKEELEIVQTQFNTLVTSRGSSPLSLSPLFQLNLDNISISPFLNHQNLSDLPMYEPLDFKLSPVAGLTMDLSLLAQSIINSYCDDELKTSYKFGQILTILKALSDKSQAILFSFASILLAINNDDRFEQFLLEAKELSIRLKLEIDSQDHQTNNDDLINYIVTLTCLSMIASVTGDSAFWKETFEQLYAVLRNSNIKHIMSILSNEDNKNALMWVVHWFFQQDITKMIKVTNLKKIGPVFSKFEYQNLLIDAPNPATPNRETPDHESLLTEEQFRIDPIFSCCYDLYIVLGSINKIYDEFLIRINGPIDHYYKFIKPTLDQLVTEDDKIEFLNTDAYSKYEDSRILFHDWVQFNTSRLEDIIVNCTINTSNINHMPDIEIEQIIKFFTLFQRTILLYLKIKLKELCAPTYEIKQLLLHMFKTLRELSGTNLNDYLLFPLLIVGASVYEYRDKLMVKSIYLHMNKSTKFKRNLNEIWKIILEFWDINPNGVTFYMWQNAINKLDWNICMI